MPIGLATTQNRNKKIQKHCFRIPGLSMVFQDLCLLQDFPGLEFWTIKFQGLYEPWNQVNYSDMKNVNKGYVSMRVCAQPVIVVTEEIFPS